MNILRRTLPSLLLGTSLAWSAPSLQLPIQDTVLANGLTVLLYPRHESPLVACRVFFATGSVHEAPGRAGLAHMLEHMLFKGTKKVGVKDPLKDSILQSRIDSLSLLYHSAQETGANELAQKRRSQIDSLTNIQRDNLVKEELWTAYQNAGGTGLNAFTTDLATAYFVTLPREKVELFLWLEADRMQNAVLREFLSERDVVREERRMRYDDSPYGRYSEVLSSTFWESHPYRIPTIGWPSDIEQLTKAAAEEHYRKYYKPNNAVLVLVGDFEPKSTLQKIVQYFSPIPKGESFPHLSIKEPEPLAAKTVTVYKNDAKPRMDILFQAPPINTGDAYAFEAMAGILGGKSGRLYKKLVRSGLAVGADASFQSQPYTSVFSIAVEFKSDADIRKIESVVWQELGALAQGVSERELQKIKNQAFVDLSNSLSDLDGSANQLGFYQLFGGWRLLQDYPTKLSQVKSNDIARLSEKYFRYERSTTGWLLPETMKPGFAKGAQQ